MILRSLLLTAGVGAALASAACHAETPTVPTPKDKAAAQAEIWEKEQAIYAARGRGDIGAYLSNTATDYLAWSPLRAQPEGNDGLRKTGKMPEGKDQERLQMTLEGFAMNGDTAVISYNTPRTRRSAGTPPAARSEVYHHWVTKQG